MQLHTNVRICQFSLKKSITDLSSIYESTELNSKLSWSDWVSLTSKIGLTAKYRTCGILTELAIYGAIAKANFTANTGYSFGSLPTNARPTYANKTQTTDSRLYIDVAAFGDVSIKSWTNASGVGSQINFSQVFANK